LRELQDETGGFTAFIAWSYQPVHTELGGTEATGIEYLRTLAMARLVLDNFDNLQSSWVTQGGKVGQLSLAYGANDMGSVMIEENVVRAAGAEYCMDEFEVVRNIESAGFVPKRRNMHYEILGDPVFRERDVPRMHALAMARADGAGGEAADTRAIRLAARRAGRHARPMILQRDGCCRSIARPSRTDGSRSIRPPIASRASARARRRRRPDLGDGRLAAGLVNAHTHLELSWMAGAMPPSASMAEWIAEVVRLRRAGPPGGDAEVVAA
jgi:hypothetical protein